MIPSISEVPVLENLHFLKPRKQRITFWGNTFMYIMNLLSRKRASRGWVMHGSLPLSLSQKRKGKKKRKESQVKS